jgi:hypothetical protein
MEKYELAFCPKKARGKIIQVKGAIGRAQLTDQGQRLARRIGDGRSPHHRASGEGRQSAGRVHIEAAHLNFRVLSVAPFSGNRERESAEEKAGHTIVAVAVRVLVVHRSGGHDSGDGNDCLGTRLLASMESSHGRGMRWEVEVEWRRVCCGRQRGSDGEEKW